MCAWSWVPSENGEVPHGALEAGVDKDGGSIYVARIIHDGEYIPAKVVPHHNTAYFSYEGKEISKCHYEVLCPGSTSPVWKQCSNGDVPRKALTVGTRRAASEPLYVGRVFHDGTLTIGKIHRSHECCYIPYNGEEIRCHTYEALLLDD